MFLVLLPRPLPTMFPYRNMKNKMSSGEREGQVMGRPVHVLAFDDIRSDVFLEMVLAPL